MLLIINLAQSTSIFQLRLVPPDAKSSLRPEDIEKPAYYLNKGRQIQVGKLLRPFSTHVFPSIPRGHGDGDTLQTCLNLASQWSYFSNPTNTEYHWNSKICRRLCFINDVWKETYSFWRCSYSISVFINTEEKLYNNLITSYICKSSLSLTMMSVYHWINYLLICKKINIFNQTCVHTGHCIHSKT